MQIGELKVRLGVDADTFKLKDFAHALGEIPFTVAAGITALTGMSFAITDIMKNTLGLADNLRIFTSITGQSGTELERWTSVAKQLGLDANLVQSSVMGLVKSFQQFKINGTMPESMLRGLGILGMRFDPNKNPFDFMREALAKAKAKGPMGAEALSMIGIDPSLVQIGGLSKSQFNKMAVITLDDQGISAMKDFRAAIEKLDLKIIQALTTSLVSATPIMGKLADNLADLIRIIGPLLIRGTANIVGNIANAADWMKSGSLEGWEKAMDRFVVGMSYMTEKEAGGMRSSFNVVNHIHSTADPEAVAQIVNERTAIYHRKAVAAFNNGGR